MESFEQTALPTLQLSPPGDDVSVGISPGSEKRKRLFVIDEIGKMELFSQDFITVVQAVFQCPDVVVLAMIPVARQKSHWLVEELRQRPDCMLFEVWKGRGGIGKRGKRREGRISISQFCFQIVDKHTAKTNAECAATNDE